MNTTQLKNHILVILFALGILTAHGESGNTPVQTPSNYALKISGNYRDAEPLDLVLVGTGSEIRVHLVEPVRSIQAWVSDLSDGKFRVKYQIGASIPIKTENSVSYRDTLIVGEVVMTLGKPIPIIKNGDQALTLELERYE